jgi:hypothetical protein
LTKGKKEMAFNDIVNPKVKTEHFKIYADVSGTGLSPTWELQGRGISAWTIDNNQDIEKTPDVLGYVDMIRGTAQPTQTGVVIALRKNSKLAEILFDAWLTGDTSKIDAIKILQKYEFVDGTTENTCKARLEEDVMIAINNFTGEAGDYLAFDVDIHYANKYTVGTMPKADGAEITFTPDAA